MITLSEPFSGAGGFEKTKDISLIDFKSALVNGSELCEDIDVNH